MNGNGGYMPAFKAMTMNGPYNAKHATNPAYDEASGNMLPVWNVSIDTKKRKTRFSRNGAANFADNLLVLYAEVMPYSSKGEAATVATESHSSVSDTIANIPLEKRNGEIDTVVNALEKHDPNLGAVVKACAEGNKTAAYEAAEKITGSEEFKQAWVAYMDAVMKAEQEMDAVPHL